MMNSLRNTMMKPIGPIMPREKLMANPLDYKAIWENSPSYRAHYGSPDLRAGPMIPPVAPGGTIPPPDRGGINPIQPFGNPMQPFGGATPTQPWGGLMGGFGGALAMPMLAALFQRMKMRNKGGASR